MRRRTWSCALSVALGLAWADATQAQAVRAPEALPDSGRVRAPAAIHLAKWAALGAALGFAAYGYHWNRVADSRYEKLDRACQFDPVRCLPRTSTGAFVDPELERQFQDIRRLDNRATLGLVGAEVGFAGAVALFLIDLRNARREPPNIPYSPPKLQVGRRPGGRLELGVSLPARGLR